AEPVDDEDHDAAAAAGHLPAVPADVWAGPGRAGGADPQPLGEGARRRRRPDLGQPRRALARDRIDLARAGLARHGAEPRPRTPGGRIPVAPRLRQARDAFAAIEGEYLQAGDRVGRERLEEDLAAVAVLEQVGGGLGDDDRNPPRLGLAEAGLARQRGGAAARG